MTSTAPTGTLALDPHARKAPTDLVLRGPAVVALAALIVLFAQVLPVGITRAVVTAPIMLLVPGWAAYLAIFGRARPDDRVIGATFVVALGMATTVLNGLVVNAVGWRISEGTLVVGPAVFALAFLVVAQLRGAETRVRIPADARQRFQFMTIVLCCALVIGGGAVRYAAGRLPSPAPGAPFAELSFAPAFARAETPVPAVPGKLVLLPLQVRLKGDLHEVNYRVFGFVDGKTVYTGHADVSAPLWQGDIKVAAPSGRCLHQVQVYFVPTNAPGQKLVSLDTYLSVTTGAACRT